MTRVVLHFVFAKDDPVNGPDLELDLREALATIDLYPSRVEVLT